MNYEIIFLLFNQQKTYLLQHDISVNCWRKVNAQQDSSFFFFKGVLQIYMIEVNPISHWSLNRKVYFYYFELRYIDE